jgi:formylglycine-generating enzyme required for sulfatase activity
MGKYPVTQGLYQIVMGKNPSFFSEGGDAMARPVEQVSWFDAIHFCNALSKILGLDPAYKIKTGKTSPVVCDRTKTGFRLPTEAEWEYAAKSGGEKYDFVAASDPGSVSWYHANSGGTTHPVGEKRPNAWGIYDMLGNVYEWCQDRFAPYPDGDSVDCVQEKAGTTRVVRGGCWGTDVTSANPSVRRHNDPSVRAEFTGFRVCRTLR